MADNLPIPPTKLNSRQERFCRNVVAGNYPSFGVAYSAAGYRGKNRKYLEEAGGKLAKRPDVAARIAELREAARVTYTVDLNEVVHEIRAIGLTNISEFWEQDDEGELQLRPPLEWTPAMRAAASELQIRELRDGKKHVKLKLHDKLKALDMMLRIVGGYAPEKQDLTVRQEEAKAVAAMSREDLIRLEAERLGYALVPVQAQQILDAEGEVIA